MNFHSYMQWQRNLGPGRALGFDERKKQNLLLYVDEFVYGVRPVAHVGYSWMNGRPPDWPSRGYYIEDLRLFRFLDQPLPKRKLRICFCRSMGTARSREF